MKIIENFKKKFESSDLSKDPNFLKYKPFIIPVIVLILALVIAILVTIPQFISLFNTYKTIDELQTKKDLYNQKATALEGINIPEYREDLNTALVALPVDKDIPGVLGEILVALGGSGMTLDSITFSGGQAEENKASEFIINIKASGSEASLKNFLQRVTLTPRLIKLTGIELTGGLVGEVTASFNFATFYQTLPDGRASADDRVPVVSAGDTQILTDIEAKLKQFPKAEPTNQSSGSATGKLDPFQP